MEWRPEEGWDNPHDGGEEVINEEWRITYAMKPQQYYAFEDGADAMLKALTAKFPHIICLGIRDDGA